NVRPERKASELANREKVDIRLHTIIYNVVDEIKRAMQGVLEPVVKETYLGTAEVRNTFRIPKVGAIAGCYITDGKITRTAELRLLRDNVVIFEGKVASLKRFKEDASEVTRGYECGIGIQNFNDVKIGDTIEAFVTEKVMADVGALGVGGTGRQYGGRRWEGEARRISTRCTAAIRTRVAQAREGAAQTERPEANNRRRPNRMSAG